MPLLRPAVTTNTPPRRRGRRVASGLAAAALAGTALVAVQVVTTAAPAGAVTRTEAVRAAALYAKNRGYAAAVSVYDTKTGTVYSAGKSRTGFASESLIKVWIAARLIHQGRLHGSTSSAAWKMITQSDDGIASSLYGSVGGDSLDSWVKSFYKVPTLGSGPLRPGWWGSFRVTSDGLVRLYAKLKKDKKVWPWLSKAMHAHTTYGSDGFYQAFGLPQASSNVAVKQGWGSDYSYSVSNASMNSTGFVNNDRYAVAILARGPGSSYGSRLGGIISQMAKRLLPGKWFPQPIPRAYTLSRGSGPQTGGTTVTIKGSYFYYVTKVTFGATAARFTVLSPNSIRVVAPRHGTGRVYVQVWTTHGRSLQYRAGPVYTYTASPAIAAKRTAGTSTGGTVERRGAPVERTPDPTPTTTVTPTTPAVTPTAPSSPTSGASSSTTDPTSVPPSSSSSSSSSSSEVTGSPTP
ncbi:IPT/TIG domain-containing protein [Jatrophihabitans fulvus]